MCTRLYASNVFYFYSNATFEKWSDTSDTHHAVLWFSNEKWAKMYRT